MTKADGLRTGAGKRALLRLSFALGVFIVILGFALDLLPGSAPGINLPQLIVIAFGSLIVTAAALLWSGFRVSRRQCAIAALISILTLIALEMALAAMNVTTYLPSEIEAHDYSIAPFWTCDAAGCRFVQEEAKRSCQHEALTGRQCIVNRQGFFDSQDFVAADGMPERRLMMLGDSFGMGYTADIGASYVETLEAMMPDALVWNLSVMGTGTNQAVASLRAFGPLLQPQLVVLGFYVRDFEDNLLPIDSWFALVDGAGKSVPMLRKYKIDPWGSLVKLDLDTIMYYRDRGVFPPANALEKAAARTRIGSLLLRLVDALGYQFASRQYEWRRDATLDYLRHLRDESEALGSELLILLIPDRNDIDTPRERYQMALRLFNDLGIAFLDVRADLNLAEDYFPFESWDIHWTTAGHQKIGALLADCINAFYAAGDLRACAAATLP